MRHIDALTSILRLENEAELTWRAESQEAFGKIKVYLSSPPMLKASRRGVPFRLYVDAEDKVIRAVFDSRNRRQGVCHHLYKPTTYWCGDKVYFY